MLFFFFPKTSRANQYAVTGSAKIKPRVESQDKVNDQFDTRIYYLTDFLNLYGSPLANYSGYFIARADEHNLDYRLVPAISGVESTFGKRIPYNSYNAYGWANGNYYFESWEDSIETVSRSLRQKYYDRGAEDINSIAARYAPPSNSWSWKVKYFMDKIDPVPVEFDL